MRELALFLLLAEQGLFPLNRFESHSVFFSGKGGLIS